MPVLTAVDSNGKVFTLLVDGNRLLKVLTTPSNTVDTKITLDSEQVDIGDISKGTQTNDVKITLDTEVITETNSGAIKDAVEAIATKTPYNAETDNGQIATGELRPTNNILMYVYGITNGYGWIRLAGDTNGRIIESNSGDIKTAIEILDDIVETEDSSHSSGDKGVMALAVRKDTKAALATTDGDYIPQSTDEVGMTWANTMKWLNTALTGIDDIYDDAPTTNVSAAVNCDGYRQATLSFELDITLLPTDILFEVEVSLDGTNYAKLMNDFLGDLRYDDTAVGAGIEEAVTFPICCSKIRVRVTCTGTDATNKFTVANSNLYLRS